MSASSAGLITRAAKCAALTISEPLAVAVSGGADSLALMVALVRQGFSPFVLTVNHGMRPEAAAEAAYVKEVAARFGLTHHTLCELPAAAAVPAAAPASAAAPATAAVPTTQAQARALRYRLLSRWCRENGVSFCALGHHAQDQAETFLFRLYRGSGLEGLAAMEEEVVYHGCRFVRPFLNAAAAAPAPEDLKAMLRQEGIEWCEDPSNISPKYTRTHVRALLKQLPLTTTELTAASAGARLIKKELAARVRVVLSSHAAFFPAGYCRLDAAVLTQQSAPVVKAVLAELIKWVTGAVFRPRTESLARLAVALKEPRASTLGLCQIIHRKDGLYFFKEPARMEKSKQGLPLWDQRFYFDAPLPLSAELTLGALGAAARSLEEVASSPIPKIICSTLPALWQGERLIAVPHLSVGDLALGQGIKFLRDTPFSAID